MGLRCVTGRGGAQQRDVESVKLWWRQARQLLRCHTVEQVDERREREPRLGIARPRHEHAHAPLPRRLDAVLPQRRLADAGPADEKEGRAAGIGAQERVQLRELRLASDDLVAEAGLCLRRACHRSILPGQSVSASLSAIAATVTLVFARGIVGITEASATTRPFDAEHAAGTVDHAPDRARPGGMEVVARAAPCVLLEVARAGAQLGPEELPQRLVARDHARQLDALDDDGEVGRVGEEAALDDRQVARVGRPQAQAAVRRRLHVEDAHRERVTGPVAGRRREPREQHQVPAAGRATAARGLDERVRLEQRAGGCLVFGTRRIERRRGLPAEPRPVMIEEPLADGEVDGHLDPEATQLGGRPDAAAHQDCRAEVRPGGENHRGRLDALTVRGLHRGAAPALEDQAVDKRVAEHGEVVTTSRCLEIGEGATPAHAADDIHGQAGHADGLGGVVRRVEQGEPGMLGRLEERVMRRRGPVGVRARRAHLCRRTLEVRRE